MGVCLLVTITAGGDAAAANQDQSSESTTTAALRINQLQFVGSHNSYKKAMDAGHFEALKARHPQAAASLEYAHIPLAEQLDQGMRVLEIDLFYDPLHAKFPVGHVQQIDMNSHCTDLVDCLKQIRSWSMDNLRHIPIWLMFNLKDQQIEGLPAPVPFDRNALRLLDQVFARSLGDSLITPNEVAGLNWPSLDEARGKFLLLLDESGPKRDWYLEHGSPLMFANVAEDHPRAGIMVINDPVGQQAEIRRLVGRGYMVRTRADADTVEARMNDTRRRDAAFTSGAQAISTDYYRPAKHFGTNYQVTLDGTVQCNPINTTLGCVVTE